MLIKISCCSPDLQLAIFLFNRSLVDVDRLTNIYFTFIYLYLM